MDGGELLQSHLGLIERLTMYVCRKAGVVDPDVDDFISTVKLALIEDDYAVLRAWEGRSSLATYLTVVIHRLLVDERIRRTGRWRPSAEAKRLGEAGVRLEMLLQRDERSLAEAIPIVGAFDPALTVADIEAMAARLPVRAPRARVVAVKPLVADKVVGPEVADRRLCDEELLWWCGQANRILGDVLASLPIADRVLIRRRFGSMQSIANIARLLQVPPRPLYRRLEQILRRLRRTLETAGVDARAADALIGSAVAGLDFRLWDEGGASASETDPRPGG